MHCPQLKARLRALVLQMLFSYPIADQLAKVGMVLFQINYQEYCQTLISFSGHIIHGMSVLL